MGSAICCGLKRSTDQGLQLNFRDAAVLRYLKMFVSIVACMRQNFPKNQEKNVVTALNLTVNSAIYIKSVLN
jgi:hypothetical protein